ncbi:MAG: hypothetical protein J6Z32_01770 [Bacteroidales bacterium]|nr:hypothetical protein [Bacteroidales bacterium]
MRKSLILNILAITVLWFAVGCAKEDSSKPIDKNVYKLNVKAGKDTKAVSSKALHIEDVAGKNYLRSSWSTTEHVYVRKSWIDPVIGTLTPQSEGNSAVLGGTISGPLAVNDHLTFTFPRAASGVDYTGQDGTLETISSSYDYCQADAYIESIDGENNITLDQPLVFTPSQTVVKFTLVDEFNNPIYPTKITLDAYNDVEKYIYTESGTRGILEVNIDQTVPHNEIYVAMSLYNTTFNYFRLKAYVGSELLCYKYDKNTTTTFNHGYYYEVNARMTQTASDPSVTFGNLRYNFNFTINGSADWAGEGKVFVFFKGVTTGYWNVSHISAGDWLYGSFVDLNSTKVEDVATNGTLTAVWIKRRTSETPSYSAGKWAFDGQISGVEYLSAVQVPYTVSVIKEGDPLVERLQLNANINLVTPAVTGFDVVTEFVNSVKVACNNLKPIGFASVNADGSISEVSGNDGDWLNIVNGYAYAQHVATPSALHYYALHRTESYINKYYHLLDDDDSRLTILGDGAAHISAAGGVDWIQVGPGYFVENLAGKTWWTTNLASDRHSAEPHPWTTTELTWTTENQWNEDRGLYSLSKATFDYDSELPEPFNWEQACYIHQNINVCGMKGFIFGDASDISKFIFLPFPGSDFLFFARIGGTSLQFHRNWNYWAKGYYPTMYMHEHDPDGTDDRHWKFNWASALHFPTPEEALNPFYTFYNGSAGNYDYRGIPDYGAITGDNVALYFPARPVRK